MTDSELTISPDRPVHGQHAGGILSDLLAAAGWDVQRQMERGTGFRPDIVVRRGSTAYAVEVKTGSEGRSDRLIPLWSQACLQATRAAGGHQLPLAVVAAPRIPPRVAEQVLEFAAEFAPGTAAGVIDFAGLRMFRGHLLEELNAEGSPKPVAARPVTSGPANIFSDLNQWMLKVLLAPELPESMLSAPRGRYRNSSQLARAANVSVMSASRLVRQLQHEGYLHESAPYLDLVRREDLFRRWQASAVRPAREAPFRFLLRGNPQADLKRILQDGHACLGLFAAAEALKVGLVHGVPPHVYVKELGAETISAWRNVVPAEPDETPELILRQAAARNSVFRGLVRVNGTPVCDVLQVWLDVSSHPARGQEQAGLIRRDILNPLIEQGGVHG